MDSMDVMQSVHRSLLTGLKNDRFDFASPQQLIGLAVLLVQRKVARHWRKLKQLPAASTAQWDAVQPTPLDEIASSDCNPVETASANELLEKFLTQLAPLDRELVRLKLAGHTAAESASFLGRDPAYIRMRWSRLRQILQQRNSADE
jgi:RNA polymerase sigma-70 factor (ECF subfamily)